MRDSLVISNEADCSKQKIIGLNYSLAPGIISTRAGHELVGRRGRRRLRWLVSSQSLMTNGILSNEPFIRLGIFLGIFAVMGVWE